MNQVKELSEQVLNKSLSFVVRRAALFKLRKIKSTVDLGTSLIHLIRDVDDKNLQKECLQLAGEISLLSAVDVIAPISKGKGLNARYAINALGKIGGSKAYRLLMDLEQHNGPEKYQAKKAMREIEQKEPGIIAAVQEELEDFQQSFIDLKDAAVENLAQANLDPQSDPIDLKSDPINIKSDSNFYETEGLKIENKHLKKELESTKQNFSLLEQKQDEIEQNAEKRHKIDQEILKKKNLDLQHELDEINKSFRDEKKRWKDKVKEVEDKIKEEKKCHTEDSREIHELKKIIKNQERTIERLQNTVEKNFENKLEENTETVKKWGTYVTWGIVFLLFVTCR